MAFGILGRFVRSFVSDIVGVVWNGLLDIVGIDFEPDIDPVTGIEVNRTSNIKKRPVVYGTRRIGGVRVFVGVSGNDNEFLNVILDLCEGEIKGFIRTSINDRTSADWVDGIPTYGGFMGFGVIGFHDEHIGSDTQAADATMLTEFPGSEWTSDHQLKGIAYLYSRFKYTPDVYTGGIPNVIVLLEGKKVLNVTTSVTEYTTDPASCIYDYCINDRYGRGIDVSELNLASFQAAAIFYAEQVESFSGGANINRFEMNMVVDTEKTVANNIRSMLASVRSHLPYINGQYHLKPLKGETSVFSFSEDNIVSGIKFTDPGKRSRLNRVKVGFTNPLKNWQTDYVVDESSTFLAEDNGVSLSADVMLAGETNFYRARHYAETILKESREAIQCTIRSNLSAWQIEVGEVVDVSYASYGWVNKTFRAWAITLEAGGGVVVNLKEHENSVYDYDVSSEEPSPPDTELPDPFTVATPSLTLTSDTVPNSDGTIVPRIKIAWTDPTEGYTDHYVLEYRKSGASNWTTLNISRATEHFIPGVEIGQQYNVRLKSVNTYGVSSAYDTDNITPGGDTTAPGAASSLVAVTALKGINLKWNQPTVDAEDLDHIDIYRHTSDIPGGDKSASTLIASVKTDSYTDTDVDSGTEYFYWLKAVDTTGNVGVFFPSGSGIDAKSNTMINTLTSYAKGPYTFDFNHNEDQLVDLRIRNHVTADKSKIDFILEFSITNSEASSVDFDVTLANTSIGIVNTWARTAPIGNSSYKLVNISSYSNNSSAEENWAVILEVDHASFELDVKEINFTVRELIT